MRRLGRDAGFTLPELLVGVVLGLIVVGTGAALFASGIRTEPRIADRADAIQQARTMAERVSRELRQGSDATSVDPTQLTVLTFVPRATCGSTAAGPATRCRVFYSCDGAGTCTRTECDPNTVVPPIGCGSPVQVVKGLASDQVFAFSPRLPGLAYVSVKLVFPATGGEDAITIEDGVALRNPPLGGA